MMRGVAQINDLGEYRMANLSPGRYYVRVQAFPGGGMGAPDIPPPPGKPDVRPVRTCYPSATTLANATPIDVKAGQDSPGMNVQVQQSPTYHVRDKVVGAAGGINDHGMLSIAPRGDEPLFFFGNRSNIKPDGSFDIAGVAPGTYVLSLSSVRGEFKVLGRTSVDVGSGDVNGVEVPVLQTVVLQGRVRVDGTPPAGSAPVDLAHLNLRLWPTESIGVMGMPPQAKFGADGSFTIDNVLPGKYTIQASAPPGTYLASAMFGSNDALKKELDLSGGGGELDIVFRYGTGEVDGSIKQAQESGSGAQTVPSGQVILDPDTLNADGSGIHFSSPDNHGSFSFKQVPPGHYRAYALEDADFGELQNPELLKALEPKATDVQVKENDKLQIQLPLIPPEDFQRIAAQAGIAAE